jgi:uncharacterized Zn-binding protein involved in type VI secretion
MGTVSVNPPKTPVTKGSNGLAPATLPNICKMPGPPAPFVPVPLPNIGKSGDSPKGYSTKVKIDGQAVAIQGATFNSMGDIASKGTGGGLISMNTHGPTKFVAPGSLNVKIEGKNVQLLGDQMLNNCGPSGSPPNSACMAGEIQIISLPAEVVGEPADCPNCRIATKPSKNKGRKSYDEFFDDADKAELDALAAANPDLAAMFPPKGGQFRVLNAPATKRGRDRFETAKAASGVPAGGDVHHPHSIKTGGCPVHQDMVQKPDEEPGKSKVQAVDDKINEITNRAIERNR